MIFPDDKKFAFTIFDDTDKANLENIQPIYTLLKNLGTLTTKSVWVLPSKHYNNIAYPINTLEDKKYLNFIRNLQKNGFEIALHGVAPCSSKREKTILGIKKFKNLLGFYPTSYCVHLNNQENLYWDKYRLSSHLLKLLIRIYKKQTKDYFQGHIESSPYFWGDICKKYIKYVRNFTFKEINLLNINPTIPYKEVKKPFVQYWFSSSNGQNCKEFNNLLSLKNQKKLEDEGGVCIVYTHFAFGFVKNGIVNPKTKYLLETLSKRNGWFVPVTPLLDYLRKQQNDLIIHRSELWKMEWRWFLEKIFRNLFLFKKEKF